IPTRYLELTQQKFDNARLPGELVDGDEDHRVRNEMDALIDHWHEKYSWRDEEHTLNSLPQYRLAVPLPTFGPLRHHFLWHRACASSIASSSSSTTATPSIPLLLLGEFWEFLRLFRTLQGRGVDIVLPSPAGMGFSDAPTSPGFGAETCARGFHALMQRLGYSAGYVIHASGTLGWAVGRMLALRFPDHVRGLHLSYMPLPKEPNGGWWTRTKLRVSRRLGAPWSRAESLCAGSAEVGVELVAAKEVERMAWEYALTDSPMGLLAWVAGRIRAGATTHHEWTHNEILTAFMYYWISGPRDFLRLLETSRGNGELDEVCARWSPVPMGVFLGQDQCLPRGYIEATLGKVVLFETRQEAVGRWVAWEEPEVVADAVMRLWKVTTK
ncbi:alpha/beta-hydrolase, partial [Wilcoxina mikolae CBS 423.85]